MGNRLILTLLSVAMLACIAVLPTGDAVTAQDPDGDPASADPDADTGADPDDGSATTPRQRQADPFLQYAKNVEVRISQLEVGDFPTVRAFVSVTDEGGLPIRSLLAEDFTVTENGAAAEVAFANRDELNLPLSIQLVLDVSGSMDAVVNPDTGETALDMAKQAVVEFIGQLAPGDRVGLIAFSDAAIREVQASTNHAELLRRLDQLIAWGQTTLWDAVFLGMEELLADPQPARRALIVLSDGWDNKSLETPQSILQWYRQEALDQNLGFSIYSMGLGPDIDRGALAHVATQTGGLYFDTPTAAQLADVYQDILSQIQSEYLLQWQSPGESQPGQIIDVSIGITPVKSHIAGTQPYRSPGLSAALARALWPGLITIAVLIAVLVIATIFRISRRTWLTVMITPLEGKDHAIGTYGAEIGTLESCEVRLPADPAMLPLHASLQESADGFVLVATDPQSPIIMGGQLLARKLLRSGDRFTLGTTAFVFNERVVRPGDGEAVLAEHVAETEQPLPLTEEAQLAGQEGGADAARQAVQRQSPRRLVAVSGPHAGLTAELADGDNIIGRQEGSIQLGADSQVSRRHCVIVLSASGALLTDPGSTNGTRLNGQPCQAGIAQPVWAGDALGIGAGEYRLE